MYRDLNVLNLKIIYSKSRESVELNLELIRLETFAFFKSPYKWNFTRKFENH